jgi:hypothetical protein
MKRALFLLAALPCLAGSGAVAADLDGRVYSGRAPAVTVTRMAAADCQPVPTMVAPGRRGMGEPGTFYAYWELRTPYYCSHVIDR